MQKFLDTVLKNIPEIQNEFDKYQKEYFPIRTPAFSRYGKLKKLLTKVSNRHKNLIVDKKNSSDRAVFFY